MKLFALGSFLYIYTLQAGVATFCSWGLGLMSITMIVNFSNLLTSFVYTDDANDVTFAETGVHYAVFFVFISLGFVAYTSAMVGAYQEKPFHMKLAIGFLCVQGILWLFLTLLSFVNVEQLTGFLCVEHLRCADRFFISNTNWRYSQVEPDFFWNFHPSTDPSRIFRTNGGCWNYCRGLQPDEKTTLETAPTTTEGTTSATTVTTEEKTEPTKETTGTTKYTTKATKTTAEGRRDLNLEVARRTGIDSLGRRMKRQGPTSTTPGPTTTGEPTTKLPSGNSCTCSKTRVETLVGPLGSTVHLVVGVLFAVLILVFWYGYCFCIFFSYINFLKTKQNKELSESSVQAVSSQQEPSRHKSSLKWSSSS